MEQIIHSRWFRGGAGPHYPQGAQSLALVVQIADDFLYHWSAGDYSGQDFTTMDDAIHAACEFLSQHGWTEDPDVAQRQARLAQFERQVKRDVWRPPTGPFRKA